jgi:hypothetical protein
MMAMVFKETGNLGLIRDWILDSVVPKSGSLPKG